MNVKNTLIFRKGGNWVYNQEDFTEENYRSLLQLAKQKYCFIAYDQYRSDGSNILWRHDIDFSVHRALKLATIEAEEGVKATYFIHLHNESYNALEAEVAKCIHKIVDMGHDIGLHFDPSFYILDNCNLDKFEFYLKMEQQLLETIFGKRIRAFSFHVPEVGKWVDVKQEIIGGLINAYSSYLGENYGYCSDSNGYWRFKRLEDVLREAKEEKLQVLTHPEWWVPSVMSPRDRITRCIDGRAAKQHKWYDAAMQSMGRKNIMSD